MKISMLTGDNPFYNIQEEPVVYATEEEIMERVLQDIQEGTYHPGVPGKKDGGYEHTLIAHGVSKKEFSNHSHAVKHFRDTIEKHHSEHLAKHGKLPSHEETAKHLEKHTKTRTAKDGIDYKNGGKPHNSELARTQIKHNTYHTHIHADHGKESEGETNHNNHIKGHDSSHTADHMLHWRKHENGKIHIMGISSKDKNKDNSIAKATEDHAKDANKGKGKYHQVHKHHTVLKR